jgi:hypothetical protein
MLYLDLRLLQNNVEKQIKKLKKYTCGDFSRQFASVITSTLILHNGIKIRSINSQIHSSSSYPYPLSGVGTKCFSSCCDKDSAIIFTPGHLPDVNPP